MSSYCKVSLEIDQECIGKGGYCMLMYHALSTVLSRLSCLRTDNLWHFYTGLPKQGVRICGQRARTLVEGCGECWRMWPLMVGPQKVSFCNIKPVFIKCYV